MIINRGFGVVEEMNKRFCMEDSKIDKYEGLFGE